MTPESAISFRSGKWRGYALAAWADEFASLDDWLQRGGEDIVVHKSRFVQRRALAGKTVYLKYIYALTDAGLEGRELFSFLKWYCRPSRALAFWRISRQLLDHGFRCAVPVLAARRRSGKGYPNDIIVTAEVPFPTLEEVLTGKTEDECRAIIANAARQLREFHAAGFVHGDCILRNICLDDEKRLVYLDNDRTKRPSCLNFFCSWKRNLAQFGYSLRRCRPELPGLLACFYDTYFADGNKPQALVARQTAAIEKRLAARLRR